MRSPGEVARIIAFPGDNQAPSSSLLHVDDDRIRGNAVRNHDEFAQAVLLPGWSVGDIEPVWKVRTSRPFPRKRNCRLPYGRRHNCSLRCKKPSHPAAKLQGPVQMRRPSLHRNPLWNSRVAQPCCRRCAMCPIWGCRAPSSCPRGGTEKEGWGRTHRPPAPACWAVHPSSSLTSNLPVPVAVQVRVWEFSRAPCMVQQLTCMYVPLARATP